MITCRRAAELTSRSLDGRLSLAQRALLRLHALTCGGCRRYGDQLRRLHRVLARLVATTAPAGPGLPPAARERLRAAVRRRAGGG
jgi:predicted anti-sigma-YlaC factor YlaD